MRIFMSFIFVLCFSAVSFAGVYKWKDDEGKVHYTNSIANVPREYRDQVEKKRGKVKKLTAKQKRFKVELERYKEQANDLLEKRLVEAKSELEELRYRLENSKFEDPEIESALRYRLKKLEDEYYVVRNKVRRSQRIIRNVGKESD